MLETSQQKLERLLLENLKESTEIKNAILNLNSKIDFLQSEIKTVIGNQKKIDSNIQSHFNKEAKS
jgi:hypothetical protein